VVGGFIEIKLGGHADSFHAAATNSARFWRFAELGESGLLRLWGLPGPQSLKIPSGLFTQDLLCKVSAEKAGPGKLACPDLLLPQCSSLRLEDASLTSRPSL